MIADSDTWFLNMGGGDNSRALGLKFIELGVKPPSAIYFADTGGESSKTYQNLQIYSELLVSLGFPPVETLRWIRKRGQNAGRFVSLEEQCLTRNELPSLAYGNKGCSVKRKGQVVDAAVKAHPDAVAAFDRGEQVIRVLGYDADEPHRWNRSKDDKFFKWIAPLVEWDMGREECVELILKYGLEPGKSACIFCPARKNHEILEMAKNRPEDMARCLAIEDGAINKDPAFGLGGRNRKWRTLIEQADRQQDIFSEYGFDIACGCYD